MDKKNLIPTVVGVAVSLGVLYLMVRVASAGWTAGQK
jgi:hypothetical protein